MSIDRSPLVPPTLVKKWVQVTEHNNVARSFNAQVEYESDDLPDWFKPLQPIIEDTTFTSMVIVIGEGSVHYIITAIPY